MPTNTQIVASLSWTDAPPDLSCVPGDLNQLGQVLAQFLAVNSTTNELDTSSQNSIAQQALEQSAIALATAQAAQTAQPSLRSSGNNLIKLGTNNSGDSTLTISWGTDMPDTDYMVIGTFFGDEGTIGAHRPNFRVVNGSRKLNKCQIEFNDIPQNYYFSYLIRSLAF